MNKDDNIFLRKIEYSDSELIVSWRNSNDVKVNLFSQEDISLEQHLSWMKNKVESGESIQFIIEAIKEKKPIGTIFIKNIDNKNNKGEFGIFIGDYQFRGLGYGTMATKMIVNYAFTHLCLNKIYLHVIENNQAGIHSYKKAGFKIEGVHKQDYKRNGVYFNVVYMSILKEEWEVEMLKQSS